MSDPRCGGGELQHHPKHTRMAMERMGSLLIWVDFSASGLSSDLRYSRCSHSNCCHARCARCLSQFPWDTSCRWIRHGPVPLDTSAVRRRGAKVCLFATGWMPPNFGGTWMASICQQSLGQGLLEMIQSS